MASLTNTKIKNTYVSLLKVADNGQLDAALQDITDGAGNTTGIQLNTGGDLTASGTVAFGSLKDSGENITITKFVDAADGIGSNNNDTTIPTSAAVSAYVASQVTLEDLDFAGDSGTGSVDLDSQSLTIQGTANEIETVASNQTLTIGLPSTINVNVNGNLTGNVTATSVLQDGVTATTQLTSDNSTKVATTAFVKSVVTAENLDIAGTSGTGSVDLDSQVLTIAGTTNEIETNASGQTITVGLPSDVIIGNDLTVTTDASVGGTLDVTGATGIDGNFDVATNKFTVQAATGNTAVAGTLGVTGNTTLSTVDVTGLASLDGGIDVDGAFTVANTSGDISTSGTLGVTGTSTLGVINASGLASLDGGIDVDGAFTVADTTGNISTTGSLTAATGTINGLLDVVGEVQATFLDINGNGEVSGNLAVDTDTLFVDSTNDRVGINKTNPAVALDVTGDITSSGTVTGVTLAGTLSTAAQTNITSVGTLSSLAVSGDLTVDTSTLKVDSANNRVGIGNASPSYKLSVYSEGNYDTIQNLLNISAKDTSGGTYNSGTGSGLSFSSSHWSISSTEKVMGAIYGANESTNNGANGYLTFHTRSSDSVTERMRIDSSGRVAIGTTDTSGSSGYGVLNISGSVNGAEISLKQNTTTVGYMYANPSIFVYDSSQGGYHSFQTSSTQRARIDADGLKFGSDSAAANALDDYEEGTWTPTLPSGGTLSNYASEYTKIGRQVTVTTFIYNIAPTNDTNTFRIGGLPFAAGSGSRFWGGSFGYAGDSDLSDFLPITGASLTNIYFQKNDGISASVKNADYIAAASGSLDEMIITITYFTP